MKYEDLSNFQPLNQEELFEVKGGYVCFSYGCERYVCAIARSGAEKACSTAYCRYFMGPESPDDSGTGTDCRLKI